MPKVASHSEGRQDFYNINTAYLALSAPQSFWSIHGLILQLCQCAVLKMEGGRKKKKKKNASQDMKKGML